MFTMTNCALLYIKVLGQAVYIAKMCGSVRYVWNAPVTKPGAAVQEMLA